MTEEESERLEELHWIVEIVAVAQAATIMAHGSITVGMSPNLLLPLVKEMSDSAAVAPLTKADHELILETVLKTLAMLNREKNL